MGLLSIFKKENYIKYINVSENYIEFDNRRISFPASLEEITNALGSSYEVSQDEHSLSYNFYNEGFVFKTCDDKNVYLKYRKAFIDQQHNIVYTQIYGGQQVVQLFHETCLPTKTCKALITFNGKPLSQFFKFFDRQDIGLFSAISFKEGQESLSQSNGLLNGNVTLSFNPPRPQSNTNYKIKPCDEEILEFDNFNFKLCILQVLIYDLELLTPYFDIDEFADWYTGKEIDTESPKPIRAVMNYFKKLPIPKKLAEYVTEIYMDGGNDIYMNIAPQWDGEGGIFDLDNITEKELLQFPSLTKMTLMSRRYEELSLFLEKRNIKETHIQ